MKGFKVIDGDISIKNGAIEMVEGKDLLVQKVQQVLGTNLGEWAYNPEEGIQFYAFLRKSPDDEEIRDNIRSGLLQVDESFSISAIDVRRDGRKLYVDFTAKNSAEQEITMTIGR